MSDSANLPTHSGFAQFSDDESRETFIRTTLDRHPELKERAYISGSRPTVVFENLTPHQYGQVLSALRGLGRWFDDVQFRTTS